MKNINSICELRDKIQNLVDAHPEELQDIFDSCDNTEDSAQIRKEYDEKVNPDRKLHVGIVGRVKAGKSSLLNSLSVPKKDLIIGNSENYGRGLFVNSISATWYNTDILKTCLEEIKFAL